MRLTDSGRLLLTESRAVLERVEEAVKASYAMASGNLGELQIGCAPTLTARILPPALRAFQTEMPSVRVKLHDLSTEEMLSGLHEGRLRLAFVVRPRTAVLRGLRFEELLRDPLRLAVAPNHPLARRRVVALADTVREPFIAYNLKDYPDYHELLARMFPATTGRLRIVEETDGGSSLISAVGAGNGVALMPKSLAFIAGARLKLLPLTPAPKPLSIGIVSPASGRNAAAESFLKHAKEALTEK